MRGEWVIGGWLKVHVISFLLLETYIYIFCIEYNVKVNELIFFCAAQCCAVNHFDKITRLDKGLVLPPCEL